jgi:hypothetical protein
MIVTVALILALFCTAIVLFAILIGQRFALRERDEQIDMLSIALNECIAEIEQKWMQR